MRLVSLFAAVLITILLTLPLSAAQRPNVLLIICDDLNDSIDGMGGHPQARTPNIDRLAKQGIRFTNAHTNDPLCAPSRASLWSGLYPHNSRSFTFAHWKKNEVLAKSVMCMQHFRDNGYGVYGTGKVFHNGQEAYDAYTEYGHEASFGPFPWDGVKRAKRRRPGKEYAPNWKAHPASAALYENAQDIENRWEHSFGPLSEIPNWKPDPNNGIPGYRGWRLYNEPFRYVNDDDRDLMPDELSANWAVEVLKRKHKKPFFLVVGFARPHTPLYAPKKYFDRFPLEKIELPPYLKDDIRDCATSIVAHQPYGFQRYKMLQDAGGKAMWKRWIQAYLACVSLVDDQVGEIVDELNDGAYADNTIVIFTSDHGYHMGEKDYLFKDSTWEESTRVPLLVAAPGIGPGGGTECGHPVSLIDLYPTLVDLCDLSKNPNAKTNGRPLDGHSLRPFLKNPRGETWDGPAVALSMVGGGPRQLHFTVRDGRWRYTLSSTGEEELYDHRTDPHEWHNLAERSDMSATKTRLRKQLLRLSEQEEK